MSTIPKPQGNETRVSILPSTPPDGIGFFGSPYSPADAMLTPAAINVKADDTLDSVINAVKGVGFYVDMIGFGGPSSKITQGMPIRPLGVNYFMNTGQTCSNGATMYQYFEGIPKGDALGEKVQKAMRDMGLPGLKGLAPGMMEDAERGLNPMPLMTAMLGSGYPQCKRVTLQVGDAYGQIRDPDDKTPWIERPDDAFKRGGLYYQTRWVQDTDGKGKPVTLNKKDWTNTPKQFNPDGTPKKEGFSDMLTATSTVAVVAVLCFLAYGVLGSRR
jgi:hypothetical protein